MMFSGKTPKDRISSYDCDCHYVRIAADDFTDLNIHASLPKMRPSSVDPQMNAADQPHPSALVAALRLFLSIPFRQLSLAETGRRSGRQLRRTGREAWIFRLPFVMLSPG